MAETVLVTAHDLPLAGKLRTGFKRGGYGVEFLAKGEAPTDTGDPVLLVLTGGMDTDGGRLAADRGREMGLPVFAVLEPGREDAASGRVTGAFFAPTDPDEIVLMGRRTIERNRLRRVTGIVGETDAMVEVLERIVQIAPVDATVLITGESGTGKELVARGLHALSRRRHQAFIPVNVAALSESLLESELFGHEKGAFTGAIDMRRGLFELADRGTIFLDEIGEMPTQTQTKLLRVLEQQEFLRVGGQKPIRVNVRILAATNQRLQERVAVGDFRKDLYYRLNVLHISLPPLRDRREDIPRLVDAFIREASARHDRGPFRGISEDAMEILVRHPWPGNVRELRNLVESMVVLTPGRQIRAEDIPKDVATRRGSVALVPVARRSSTEGAGAMRPQLEVIFRTMMEMKVDIEDLRREFEIFRRGEAEGGGAVLLSAPGEAVPPHAASGGIVYDPRSPDNSRPGDGSPNRPGSEAGLSSELDAIPPTGGDAGLPPDSEVDAPPGSGHTGSVQPELPPAAPDVSHTVVYQPGMTLEDTERETIRVVLAQVEGNRRKASQELGIGERTLYRKVRKLGLGEAPGT